MGFIVSIIVGGIAGWLAGKIMDSEGGLLRNIILGVFGGGVGSTLLGTLGIYGSGTIGNILVSVVGACVLIAIGRLLFGGKRK